MAFSLFSTSCLNLQKVSDYATASVKGLKKFEELDYTFRKACRDKCMLEQIRNLMLNPEGCKCASDQSADSLTSVLYNSVKSYYDALSKLAANNLTSYKLDPLAKALKSGQYGEMKIDKAEVDAYAKISSILLTAFTNGYRRRKLGSYIGEANEPIQILIRALDFNLASNLAGKLNVHKQRTESVYADFINDTGASSYDKKKAIFEYNDLITEWDAKQNRILAFSKALKSISSGHQKLFEHRNKMTANEIKAVLMQHASDLEAIISELNKLKNK